MEDIEEQERWLTQHGPKLILFARQWVPTHADAEDVFHSAFIRFWTRKEEVTHPVSFLYSCVRTTALNWIRSQVRREKHERNALPQPLFQQDSDLVEEAERVKEIEQALVGLSAQRREVVVMRIWGELSFPQIGEVLGISSITADTCYRSALKQLHAKLDERIDR